jgi:ATP-binding cassette subfamily B protein
MVAVVGANGSGKTTLMKLICRLYDPSSGRIMLEGKDIREYDPQELRRRIAILFQDHKLFEFSGAENIWFGSIRSPRDDRRIARAAHLSGADGLFRRLPRGLDTLIGRMFEGSQDLSGGERQKVALARALYSDAGILILDEPSSALDPQAEADLFRHLREQTAGRAVVVISHRFSTVRMADRIYVLDDGGVIEAGTHDELMKLEGTYSRLFELQAAAYRSGAAGTYEPLSPDVVERAPGAGQCLNETGSLSL